MTRILGIDPGSQRTGVGVIDVAADGRCTLRASRSALKLLDAEDFPSRLGLLCEGLEALLDEWQPQQVAIETVFMAKSATSALKLGQARGAALATVVRGDLPVHEYAPREIKQSLVGRGAARQGAGPAHGAAAAQPAGREAAGRRRRRAGRRDHPCAHERHRGAHRAWRARSLLRRRDA